VADLFLAVADPMRRRLLELLRRGARSVGELVQDVDIAQPGVSRHLRILEEAGFVTVTPDQQRRIYSLRSEPFHELDAWITKYKEAVEGRLDRLGQLVEPKRPKVKP
jgi:DNA-binding transcriptional ArsR family regulator